MKLNKWNILYIFITILIFTARSGNTEPYGALVRELAPRDSFSLDHTKEKEFPFHNGRGKIKIPAQSLDRNEKIEVQRVEISYDKNKFCRMGDVYRFGPHGLTFNKPVLLTLPYQVPVGTREEFINIYYYNSETGKFKIMPKVDQDFDADTITAQITHFSDYVPGSGSYKVDEGLTPNSGYFKTNNEKVDPYSGNLFIDRTDINLPGRGIDLVLQSRFSSHKFFFWNANLDYAKPYYHIARGWHWRMPVFRKTTYGEYKFYTPDGLGNF